MGYRQACRRSLLCGALAVPLLALAVPAQADCTLEPGPTRAVARVIDAETLALDDGGEVRLVGALAPRAPDSGTDSRDWPPEREAKAALERLVQGRSVDLAFTGGRRSDRYGRLLAQVFVHADGGRRWVQAEMLAAGHARAYQLPGSPGCLAELTAHEQIGRERAAGLWSHAAYQIRAAAPPAELMRFRSTFQIVDGRVVHVSETRGLVLLSFGPDPRGDFTGLMKTADRRRSGAQQFDFKALEGRRVRLRGWIDRRYGPMMEIYDAAQIEVLPDMPDATARP